MNINKLSKSNTSFDKLKYKFHSFLINPQNEDRLYGFGSKLIGLDGGEEVSNAASIDLANGSGNTVITLATAGGIVGTLSIAYSTSGDPGATGTANGGSGFGNSSSHRTIDQSTYSSGTLHFRTKFIHVSGKDGTGSYTVTFTNNSEANGDFNGSLTFGL